VEVVPRKRKERRAEGGDCRLLSDRGDGYEVMEVAPRRREERTTEDGDRWRDTVYLSGRGNLHEKDGRRQRRKKQGELVIVYAEPK
jgi:hypothetical protein